MASQPVSPLRINKANATNSPSKLPVVTGQPLFELSPMAIRRNSPSFPQPKGKVFKGDTSPVNSSPFSLNNASSPRLFWQGRETSSPVREKANQQETMAAVSPFKRSSIENLKKASRVKNSSMFAMEQNKNYDPSRPAILDGRPSSTLGNYTDNEPRQDSVRKENVAPNDTAILTPRLSAGIDSLNFFSDPVAPLSPIKTNSSPGKSSLSKKTGANVRKNGFDPARNIWEDENSEEKKLPEGRGLHRHAKSVTFDQAPPQVNEYEMTTPDPSSVASGSREGSYESMGEEEDEEYSFERGSSMDHDDSFDATLEDIDKTPVVLPEDWRFMSPQNANHQLALHEEDVFDDDYGSPAPNAHPGTLETRPHQTSVNSVDSNGQPRPLPPLPANVASQMNPPTGRHSLSGTIERISNVPRSLPSPPAAAMISKSDIRRMSNGSLSMEDRLRLMMLKDQDDQKAEADKQRDRRMRRAESKESSPAGPMEKMMFNKEKTAEQTFGPRISREAVLRYMRSNQDSEDLNSDPSVFDPDVPIPSLEDPTNPVNDLAIIKQEEMDENELYSIPDLYSRQGDADSDLEDDNNSQFSQISLPVLPTAITDEGQETPRAHSPAHESKKKTLTRERMSLPDFDDFGHRDSFNLGLETYMTPPVDNESPPKSATEKVSSNTRDLPDLATLRTSIQRPLTPTEQIQDIRKSYEIGQTENRVGTPDSVIRHPASASISPEIEDLQSPSRETDSKADRTNSVGRKESFSPQLSDSQTSHSTSSMSADLIDQDQEDVPESYPTDSDQQDVTEAVKPGQKKRVSSLVQLDINPEQEDDGLGFGLEKEFDRVVEAQKRGYLMRQNTKVVVASERAVHDESRMTGITNEHTTDGGNSQQIEANEVYNSSRKISQPTWTAEPWNGKSRRKSIRVGGEKPATKRKPAEGAVPPLPGQASNVQDGLGAVAEDELAEEEAEDFEDGAERGRLFVKVVGVKDLQLPFPQHERTQFALTLDNGMHCVTTSWLELAQSAPIGQEFELVVLNELEFQLTLQMKLEEPKQERPASPTKPPTSPKKQGALGRLFGSPKKRKEAEARNQRDSQVSKRPVTPPSAYELVQGLVGKDGSFARAYILLNEHEKSAYGRPYTVDIACFNEWAMEETISGSSRSKKMSGQLQRRPPYEIGKLELQLLYVPKPKGTKDEDMPKSMNGAVRALKEAEERVLQQANLKDFEGHLSQQGGDCPFWRRRFFKLVGTKLTAYHEATLQPRATINLAKATKLIDDKSALTQRETTARGGGRRKSAFAEEEEGYMFVEEGFRIRFANGEVIDFYADSTAQKEEWMKVLSQVVGKSLPSSGAPVKGWVEMVLKREKSFKTKEPKIKPEVGPRHSSKDVTMQVQSVARNPPSVNGPSGIPVQPRAAATSRPGVNHTRSESYQQEASARSQANSPVKPKVTREDRYRKTKSMAI